MVKAIPLTRPWHFAVTPLLKSNEPRQWMVMVVETIAERGIGSVDEVTEFLAGLLGVEVGDERQKKVLEMLSYTLGVAYATVGEMMRAGVEPMDAEEVLEFLKEPKKVEKEK